MTRDQRVLLASMGTALWYFMVVLVFAVPPVVVMLAFMPGAPIVFCLLWGFLEGLDAITRR